MVKCPECGKELDPNDIVVPIFDKDGKELISCFHVKKATFDSFKEIAEKQGLNPGDVLMQLMSEFVTSTKQE